jgi:hypothetical protein
MRILDFGFPILDSRRVEENLGAWILAVGFREHPGTQSKIQNQKSKI